MKTMHQEIQKLKTNSKPINYRGAYVDAEGKLVDLQIRAAEDEANVIKGYLCVWNVVDRHRTMWVRGAFAKSIKERGPASSAKQKIIFLWQHQMYEPIGQFRTLVEDDYGLYFEAVLDDFEAVPMAKRCMSQVRSGTINQFSFGFDYIWDKVEWDEQLEAVRIYEVELFEGSAVTMGSNKETHAVRSIEQYDSEKAMLDEETEDFIKALPRSQRLELRKLLTRHISLAEYKPEELRQNPLINSEKPVEPAIDLNKLLTIFN